MREITSKYNVAFKAREKENKENIVQNAIVIGVCKKCFEEKEVLDFDKIHDEVLKSEKDFSGGSDNVNFLEKVEFFQYKKKNTSEIVDKG